MANEVISKGITLHYKNGTSEFVELENLSEIPELGGEPESVEVTNLGDGAHRYISGIKNYGDAVSFKFYYSTEQFKALNELTGSNEWKVTLPDATTCTFTGTSSVKLDGAGINAAMTYTLNIRPESEMLWA